MDLVIVVARGPQPGSMTGLGPWAPVVVHTAGGDEAAVIAALADGKQEYGDENCTAINVNVSDLEISAITLFSAPEAGDGGSGDDPPSVPISLDAPGDSSDAEIATAPAGTRDAAAPEADTATDTPVDNE